MDTILKRIVEWHFRTLKWNWLKHLILGFMLLVITQLLGTFVPQNQGLVVGSFVNMGVLLRWEWWQKRTGNGVFSLWDVFTGFSTNIVYIIYILLQ